MRKTVCDVCGKEIDRYTLNWVRLEYQAVMGMFTPEMHPQVSLDLCSRACLKEHIKMGDDSKGVFKGRMPLPYVHST